MKKFILAAAATTLFTSSAFAEDVSIVVEIPFDMESEADLETSRAKIFKAAENVCASEYQSGALAYYTTRAKEECVDYSYTEALKMEPSGKLYDFALSKADPNLVIEN